MIVVYYRYKERAGLSQLPLLPQPRRAVGRLIRSLPGIGQINNDSRTAVYHAHP